MKRKCPQCGSENVIYLLYGYPDPSYKKKKNEDFAGCCIEPDSKKYRCGDCQHEWGREDEND